MNWSEEPAGSGGTTWASIAILVSTIFWGTLWIPLRQLNQAGLGGSWATAAGFTIPLVVLLPFGMMRWRPIAASGWPLMEAGFLMVACIALYAEALLRGYVPRSVAEWMGLLSGFLWGASTLLSPRLCVSARSIFISDWG